MEPSALQIRSFDLGGGGLKTSLCSYDHKKKLTIHSSTILNLGKCPDQMEISEWARSKIPTLDKEIKSGYQFGFSLAGLDKLRSKPLKTSNIAELFELPPHQTRSQSDGSAHLLASLKVLKKELPQGRIWNFSIGTGVGFGFTNSVKEIKPSSELHTFFGQNAWDVKEPLTQKPIWEAGSSKFGFDAIVKERGGKVDKVAFEMFADRWKAFIEKKIIEHSKSSGKEWGTPAGVIFTGGHLDFYGDQLVKSINSTGLKIKAYAGPKNAGLLGAAWSVVKK